MKRIFFVTFVLSLVLVGCKQKESNEIKIGAIIPLTGYSSITGERFMRGMELAIDEINNEELPFTFKALYEDSKSSAKDANFAYRKLDGEGVKYFSGFGGQFVLGFVSATNNSDKVLFVSAAPNKNLLSLSNRCFRIYPTINMLADMVVRHIVQQNYQHIAIINVQNEAYSMCAETVINKLKTQDIEVALFESYDPACRDFKNIINKVANQNVDIIFSAGLGESSAILTKQLYANPKTMRIPIIGDMNYSTPENLAIIGEIKSPIYIVDSYIDSTFVAKFQERYGQRPNALSAYGYTIPFLIKEALLELGKDASAIDVYNYIKQHEFVTAAGTMSFDEESETNLSLVIQSLLPTDN